MSQPRPDIAEKMPHSRPGRPSAADSSSSGGFEGGRSTRSLPRDGKLDSTLSLARDPYRHISRTCDRLDTDVFLTRMLLRKTICMRGREAAEQFYDDEFVIRRGAAPKRLQLTLFGKGGVQGLDAAEHRHRKEQFMALMPPERINDLSALTEQFWRTAARDWEHSGQVVLYDAVRHLLCRSVCTWAGVPLDETDAGRRTAELTSLYEQAGSWGIGHWQARRNRTRLERWLSEVVLQIRRGEVTPATESAAHLFAWYRDLNGDLLEPRIAAVELLNVLRPTVAVSVYITLAAVALEQFPECRTRLESGPPEYEEWFVQEVRRYYPFFPAVVGQVRSDFVWDGYTFPAGTRILLDLYGTNHDQRIWNSPSRFQPDRFQTFQPGPFEFMPQGGGDPHRGHRCPGEAIAVALMKTAIRLLRTSLTYEVPPQDLDLDFSRTPVLPKSRFVMARVRTAAGRPA